MQILSYLRLAILVSVLPMQAITASEQPNWHVDMASLWGKQADQELKAVVVNKEGLVIAGGSGGAVVPAENTYKIGSGGSGVLIVYDPDLGLVQSLTVMPSTVMDMDMTPDGDLLVISGGSLYRLSPDGSTVRWQASGSGRVASDGKGGAWLAHKKTIRHIDANGKQTISFSAGTGWGCKDVAFDPKTGHVFVGGSRSARGPKSGNPVHIPWLFAYDTTGKHVWTAYNFSGRDIEAVSDMADSHIIRLHVNAQGKLYFSGDAEGGNTPYRHSTLKVGGKTDANKNTPFSGEMWKAFNSTRVLYVGQLNTATGALERGTFFYGKHMNPAKNREELGDADVYGLYADDQGRVYVSGVIRTKPRWTETAVHKEHGPIAIKGRWGHLVAPDEAFLAIFSPDMTKLEFCSGFAQGASTRYASRALAVGGNSQVAAIAGYSKQPTDFKPGESASDTTYLRNAMQHTYGGSKDGYLAVLTAKSNEPILPSELVKKILSSRFSTPSPLIKEAIAAKTLGDIVTRLTQGNNSEQRAGKLINTIGTSQLKRAETMANSDPFSTLTNLADISSFWSGSDIGTNAQTVADTLQADAGFQNRQKAVAMIAEIINHRDSMREAKGAQAASYTDPIYYKRNSSKFSRMIKSYKKLKKDFPDVPEVKQAISLLKKMNIPTNESEEKLMKSLTVIRKAEAAIRTRSGMRPVFSDKKFHKSNARALLAIQKEAEKLKSQAPEHPYTKQAMKVAETYEIPLK